MATHYKTSSNNNPMGAGHVVHKEEQEAQLLL